MNWQDFIFNPQTNWLNRLQKIANNRFQDENNALEAFNFAFDRISNDNWAKLKKFRGDSKPDTFVIAVYNNLLKDYANHKFGKCRPPTWVSQLGTTWSFIYRKLCCEKQQPKSISNCAQLGHLPVKEHLDIIRKIKIKIPSCGIVQSAVNIEDEQIADEALNYTPEDNYDYIKTHWERALVQQITTFYEPMNRDVITSLLDKISTSKDSIELDADGLLLLKLKYIEKMPMSEAAKMLGIPVKRAYNLISQTKMTLKNHLSELNLTFETV